jgi:hypothetical protein
VLLKKIERLKNRTIADRETEYAAKMRLVTQQPAEDVTLF